MRGDPGWADAEGYGRAYLFTADDIRWATHEDELRFIEAPDEIG